MPRLKKVRNIARARSRNLFISHLHEDDARLGELKSELANSGFKARDWSINKSRPNRANAPRYIRYAILGPRINSVSAMIIVISSKTHHSKWVNWEIAYAQRLGKRIVGVWAPGHENSTPPENLEKYADAVVPWNGDLIIKAINCEINSWYSGTGQLRPAIAIARYSC
jgi:hypothetical protein